MLGSVVEVQSYFTPETCNNIVFFCNLPKTHDIDTPTDSSRVEEVVEVGVGCYSGGAPNLEWVAFIIFYKILL